MLMTKSGGMIGGMPVENETKKGGRSAVESVWNFGGISRVLSLTSEVRPYLGKAAKSLGFCGTNVSPALPKSKSSAGGIRVEKRWNSTRCAKEWNGGEIVVESTYGL